MMHISTLNVLFKKTCKNNQKERKWIKTALVIADVSVCLHVPCPADRLYQTAVVAILVSSFCLSIFQYHLPSESASVQVNINSCLQKFGISTTHKK